ncbi:FAD-dependent oxidoreductase [soil metagenome]
MTPPAVTADVLVVGAGPAGLVAAWRAAAAGRSVVVVERADVVGGMAGSFEVAGQQVDFGSHRLHPSTPPVILDALRTLLGDDLQVRPRNGRIRLTGRWVRFPLRTGDLARRLPRGFAVRAALDAITGPLRRPRADTFAEVVRAGLGPTVAEEFYRPYIRKIWGVDPAELSGELARRRVSAASPTDIVRRLVRGASPAGRTFLYPRRGFGQIAESLTDAAVAAGAELRLGVDVTALKLGSDSCTLQLADGTTIDAARVWSTAPLGALAAAVDPPPPAPVLAGAARLAHRALVLVYLVLERSCYTPFDAHYFPAERVAAARLSEPRNYRDGPDPPGRTVLCAEVPCSVGDATWSADPEELGARVAADLEAEGLPATAHVAVEIRRLPRVYPVYRPTTAWDLSALELWAATQARLLTFGRQGLFVPDNTHHVLAMGWAAADALGRDGTFDHAAWAGALDRFRSFVVED